jgi:uncharacterized OB-fold protein
MTAVTNGVAAARPAPVPDEDSAAFWQGLREHRIYVQKCTQCGEVRFPPMPGCPQCSSSGFETLLVTGTGSVYSWIVVHRPIGSLTEAELPCSFVTIELDEGCRMLGRLDSALPPRIGQRVTALFVDHPSWTELAFVPVLDA